MTPALPANVAAPAASLLPRRMAEELTSARRLLLAAHRDPDGDALGAVLGLAHLLRSLGKEVFTHLAGEVPAEYRFLPGIEGLRTDLPEASWPDLAVLLDCHEPARAGAAAGELLPRLGRVAVVDHHLGRADFGQTVWVEPGFAATCEMLAFMAGQAGWALGFEAATCLFVGVQTDTGRFAYSNTTPRTYRLAAELVEAGADPWAITQEAYANSLARLQLMARVFAGMKLLAGGRAALARVSLADLAELGASPSDLDRLVEELRAIRGVEVAALLKEVKDGGVKASLRARGRVDVGALAIGLGGGGHRNAAGMKLGGGLDQAEAQLTALLSAALEGAA
jgi:phosphoesterase RecJ-like protein